jgi:hypothetical protein
MPRLDNLMAHETYWQRRLTDVTLKASATRDQRLRAVYLELAAHYVSMSELCSPRTPTAYSQPGVSEYDPTRAQRGAR